jgi:hypothetical protein
MRVLEARALKACQFESDQTHHIKTHCLPDCKSRGKLQEKEVRILGTGSVFLYGDVAQR